MQATASQILDEMCMEKTANNQGSSRMEIQNRYEQEKREKGRDIAAAGTMAGGGLGIKALHDRGFTTGRETLFHNTDKGNVKSILDKGILASKSNKPGTLTNSVLLDARLNPEKFDGLTYMSRSRKAAHGTGMADVRRRSKDHNIFNPMPVSKMHKETLKTKKNIKGRVPTWKMNLTKNPEIAGYKDADEYAKAMSGIFQNPINIRNNKKIYNNLDKGTAVFKGDVPPEYLKGSKHYKRTGLGEIKEFAKNNPKKFALGVAGTAAGAAAIGLGARHFYKKRKAKKEEEKMNKSASQILDEMCMEKTASIDRTIAIPTVAAGLAGGAATYLARRKMEEQAKARANIVEGTNYNVSNKDIANYNRNTVDLRDKASRIGRDYKDPKDGYMPPRQLAKMQRLQDKAEMYDAYGRLNKELIGKKHGKHALGVGLEAARLTQATGQLGGALYKSASLSNRVKGALNSKWAGPLAIGALTGGSFALSSHEAAKEHNDKVRAYENLTQGANHDVSPLALRGVIRETSDKRNRAKAIESSYRDVGGVAPYELKQIQKLRNHADMFDNRMKRTGLKDPKKSALIGGATGALAGAGIGYLNKYASPSWAKPAAAIGGAALGAGALGAGAGYFGSKRGNEIAKAARNKLNGADYEVDPKYEEIFNKNTHGKRMQASDILLRNHDGDGQILLSKGDVNDIIKLQRRANDYEDRYSDRSVDVDPKNTAIKTGLGAGALGAGLAGAGLYAKNKLSKRAYDELTDMYMEKSAYDRYMEKVAANPNFMAKAKGAGKAVKSALTSPTAIKATTNAAAVGLGAGLGDYIVQRRDPDYDGTIDSKQVGSSALKGALAAGVATSGLAAMKNRKGRATGAGSAMYVPSGVL